jgi:hypothetical protein
VSANLTLAVDEELLRRARIKALEQGTSVNALARAYHEHDVSVASHEAVKGFLAVAGRAAASSGVGGRSWLRDELHDGSRAFGDTNVLV